ncbi:MAG: aspartate--ammonia ligase [Bacteroidales bacterium]|nr:aspartate--ammonia ligase [Bacteroidales bacterium]
MSVYIPKNYRNLLGSVEQTEKAIKAVKDMFQLNLSAQLALLRVTAPMMVLSGQGLNDDLNGVERPVKFPVKGMNEAPAEVVHSLAKWKRLKLGELGVEPGRGIYTDMNALRPDEDLDNIHSIYVDQWDWEKVMLPEQRTSFFLHKTVRRIYEAVKVTENKLYVEFPQIVPILPEEIFFISAEELLQRYPDKSPKERENAIAKEYGAVFIQGIGGKLSNGEAHDGRAADYDDWQLNGDILLWNPVLESAFEISSMGIRVDAEALHRQLSERNQLWKEELYFHKLLLGGKLPQTIGGGIGQSRLCMFLLRKAHIGEIQSSIWPADMRETCHAAGIELA